METRPPCSQTDGVGMELILCSACRACIKSSGQSLAPWKPGRVEQSCNPGAGEVDVRGSGVQGHSQLYTENEDSQGYLRPCLKYK